jgi:hypothetical protein
MVELLLKPEAAAAFVGVSPDVLNVWAEVLGVPRGIPVRADLRLYPVTGLVSLRDTLNAEKSIVPLATGSLVAPAGARSTETATPANVVLVHVGRRRRRR